MTRPVDRTTAAMLMALLGLAGLQLAARAGHPLPGLAGRTVTTMANRDLNKEGREALTAGYYEGLINEGERLGGMNRLVTDARRFSVEDRSQPDRIQTNTFAFYELIPNADVPDYADGRARYRLKTNSAGMADREYSLTKPPGTWRIALLGDSVTRGQGAPFQGNYEAFLETALTRERLAACGGPVEILNFAVGSYSVTQMMDTALERATAFAPDLYVVAMTQLSVSRGWGHHFGLLMTAGIDLKYPYLRDVARRAGLQRDDPRGVLESKLARFRLPTIQWALGEIRSHARKHHADVLVLLVPTAQSRASLEEHFLGVREMLEGLDIPYVDLLDTFDGVDDFESIRVAERDRHPNATGHRMLGEQLYRRLLQEPELARRVLGFAPDLRPSASPTPTQACAPTQ